MSFTLAQYAQGVLGYSSLEFGQAGVMPTMASVGSYVGQAFVTKVGLRPVAPSAWR